MNQKKLVKIGIVPTIRKINSKQIEYCFDNSFYKLFNKLFKNYDFRILDEKSNISGLNIIFILGGNDLFYFKKTIENKIKENICKNILKKCLKKKIPLIGICYGMQFIGKYFGLKLFKKKDVGRHKVYFSKKNKKKTMEVNSYHNYIIKKLNSNFSSLAYSKRDHTIEAMQYKNKKIVCFMWHPERESKFKKFDLELIKSLCN